VKRHPALRDLSDDHHGALVLGRRLSRWSVGTEPLDALAAEVRRTFARELEPHFGVEERVLLPALEAAGLEALVRRTLEDHAALRALAAGAWTPETPAAFGDRLTAHVRFEERELFPRAEAVLAPDVLEAVRVASAAARAGDAPA